MNQSRLGEYGSGTKVAEDTVCPTCGRRFNTRVGMKTHHARAHNESLRVKKICKWCGEDYEVPEAWADRGDFCSESCYHEWARDTDSNEGKNAATWKERPEIECENCGDDFEVTPHRESEARFCSYECRDETFQREGHPNWSGGKIETTCEVCGDKALSTPAVAWRTRFCSRRCHAKWRSGKKGTDSPANRGHGTSMLYEAVRDRISEQSWKTVREKKSEESCRLCDSKDRLHLHHIIPILAGGTNEDWNLMTVCGDCHGRVESITNNIVDQHISNVGGLQFTSPVLWVDEEHHQAEKEYE